MGTTLLARGAVITRTSSLDRLGFRWVGPQDTWEQRFSEAYIKSESLILNRYI